MKKAIAILLALLMVLSLAACGGSEQKKSSDTITSTDLVGTWKSDVTNVDGTNRIILMQFSPNHQFQLGMINYDTQKQEPAFNQSGSWSITDEGIQITHYSPNGTEMKYTITYNAKKDTLTNGKYICERFVTD